MILYIQTKTGKYFVIHPNGEIERTDIFMNPMELTPEEETLIKKMREKKAKKEENEKRKCLLCKGVMRGEEIVNQDDPKGPKIKIWYCSRNPLHYEMD